MIVFVEIRLNWVH